MKISSLIGAVLSVASISLHSSVSAATNSSTSSASSSGSSDSNSEIAFIAGNDGIHQVNEDVIETKNGALQVNGVSYGTVNDKSVIKYTVRGNKKTVYVDGVVRKPVR